MRAYVTGATGFVGSHVARELRERGVDVVDRRVDLLDPEGLERAVDGCEAVVHVAALYSYDAPVEDFERVNVEGTRLLLDVAARAGVRRFLHCSTAGTCGPVPGRPATEADEPPTWELEVPYKRTKLAAERLALDAGAVVVNPTTPVGEGDHKPTPTGRMIAGVATGRLRGFVATTGLNLVDGKEPTTATEVAARLAGVQRPRLRVPYAVAKMAALAGIANRDEVRLARLPMYFSSEKARSTLGYEPGPVEPALARAVAALSKGGA